MVLYQVCSNYATGTKKAPSRRSHVLHRLIWWKTWKKSSCLKPDGLESWYLVCSITWWTSTKSVQNMPIGPKMAPLRGSHVLHRLIWWKTWNNFLVWNYMTQSLDIWYVASPGGPLPSLFKLCPWSLKWPHPGGHIFNKGLNSEKHKKKYCLKSYGL